MKSNSSREGCDPKKLTVITDKDKSVVIIQAELIAAIGTVTDKDYASGKKTFLQLNTLTPSTFNFFLSPEELLEQIQSQL